MTLAAKACVAEMFPPDIILILRITIAAALLSWAAQIAVEAIVLFW